MNLQKYELYETSELQEIIGGIPGTLQRWGTLSLVLFLAVLLSGSYFFKCPKTLSGRVVIPASTSLRVRVDGQLYLPAVGIGEVRTGDRVLVSTDAYPEAAYGMLCGKVLRVYGIPNGAGYHRVDVRFTGGLKTTRGMLLSHRLQLSGKGEVMLEEHRLLSLLVRPLCGLSQPVNN